MRATDAQQQAFEALFHDHGRKLNYRKGEYIIRPRESQSDVFLIESGLVKAFDITKYAEENLLIIRRPGEVFPLIWAISGDERPIIYEALTACTLWRLPRDLLSMHVEHNPDAYAPLLDMVVDMYRVHAERIFTLEYRTVRERLVSFLLMMSARFGRPVAEGMLIDVPLRRQDVASSINASRETIGREFAILERQNLVATRQMYITLLDTERLHKVLA